MQIELGAKGPETSFVTGAFVLDDPLARQILGVLPPVMRMRPEVEQGVPSFVENIKFITREVEPDRPGGFMQKAATLLREGATLAKART
jgi:Cupin